MEKKRVLSKQEEALMAKVCHLFRLGKGPGEIKTILADEGIKISVKLPYDLLLEAVDRHLIIVNCPTGNELSDKIKKTFSLEQVDVTFTNRVDDIASRAAFVLLDLVKDKKKSNGNTNVHIGFSGGHTVRKIFQEFAHLLAVPLTGMPATITCHALVAGFDTSAPGSDPTSFFVFLSDQITTREDAERFKFTLLHAPPVVTPSQYEKLFELPALKEAKKDVEYLDIIVTSAAVFTDEHSQLRRYFEKYAPKMIPRLRIDECIGDILWSPISKEKRINLSGYPYRPVTLVDLGEFPVRISGGTRILLALGPCADSMGAGCPQKTEVLRAILGLEGKTYITHLVTNSLTATELIGGEVTSQ